MDKIIDLFGFSFICNFSPHALKRCRQRHIWQDTVLMIFADAEDEMGDWLKDGESFIIKDDQRNISVVAVFRSNIESIEIITVIDKANARNYETDVVIHIQKNGQKTVDRPKEKVYTKTVQAK